MPPIAGHPIPWRTVRIPGDLAGRIDRLAAEILASYQAGRGRLPNRHAHRVPSHHVIDRAVREMEDRRRRSRLPRRRPDTS